MISIINFCRYDSDRKKTTITCPYCGNNEELEMPTNFCQIIYMCPNCGKTLTPKIGDCCVFCSYADKKCPPIQEENKKI